MICPSIQVTKSYQSKNATLNEAIKDLTSLTNKLTKTSDDVVRLSLVFERALCSLCVMVAPFAPHVASEMWRGIAGVSQKKTTFDMVKKNNLFLSITNYT